MYPQHGGVYGAASGVSTDFPDYDVDASHDSPPSSDNRAYRGPGGGVGGGGGGGTNYPNNAAAFADFMRNNDPNADSHMHNMTMTMNMNSSNNYNAGGYSLQSSAPSTPMSGAASRRATNRAMTRPTTPLASIPSHMSTGPTREPSTMSGVGVGVSYDTDSADGHTPLTPAAAAMPSPTGGGSYTSSRGGVSEDNHMAIDAYVARLQQPNLKNDSSEASYNLPNPPYQDMMQQFAQEDPMIERARHLMATHQKNRRQPDRPYPRSGMPLAPTDGPVEPDVPPSRLGRRCLTQKPERKPDFVRGKTVPPTLSSNNRNVNTKPLENVYVDCVGCGIILEISKSAVVVFCPKCDQVHLADTCRIHVAVPSR